ncbi:MAG: hypothetical protein Q9208_008613 [Pyrenodesmia sp. 3 TL-2023]
MPSKHEVEDGVGYIPPQVFENIGKWVVPSPTEANRRSDGQINQARSTVGASSSQAVQDCPREETYDAPDSYEGLDKINAPSPAEELEVERPQGYLEGRRSITTHAGRASNAEPHQDRDAFAKDKAQYLSPGHRRPQRRRATSASHPRVSLWATELYTVSHLIFFSILGTLARLGLQALTFYPGAPVQTGVLWANVAGSLILGFLIEDRKLFRAHSPSSTQHPLPRSTRQISHDEERHKRQSSPPPPNKKIIPLYIGLAAGFCGSFTSFSSFMRDAFLALANALPVPVSHASNSSNNPVLIGPRNGGYSLMALLAVLITTVALSISALVVGAQLALALEPYTPSVPYLFARKMVDRGIVLLAWGCWLGAIFMAIWPPDRHHSLEQWRGRVLFAIVFAPLGCLARFYISLLLNRKVASFPLGTFAINMFGTSMEGIFWDLQHAPSSVGGGLVGCQVLQGMMDGFCGAATTVSTWAAELRGLRRRHAWIYGAVSVLAGLGLLVGIMGGALWGRGWESVVCS